MRIFVIVVLVALLFGSLIWFLIANGQKQGGGSAVFITERSSVDTDKDQVPDWLETLTGTDPEEKASFVYHSDLLEAKEIESLLYGGPGEITNQIIQRLLLDSDAEVSDAEKEQMIQESVAYFEKRIEERGLPDIPLTIQEDINGPQTFGKIAHALHVLSEVREPIHKTIADMLGGNRSARERAQDSVMQCARAGQQLPLKITEKAHDSYLSLLKFVYYSCHALEVSLQDMSAENFLYILKLIVAIDLEPNASAEEQFTDFIEKTAEALLGKSPRPEN